jgi:membrane-bound inhibitor of C-type lysozyme
MSTIKEFAIGIVVLIVLLLGFSYFKLHTAPPANTANNPIAQVSFACDAGKTINASFYQGASTPAASADQPPTPGGSVALKLSDGRTMTLPQTISADGTRYANADESFIFWAKGNGAFIMEGNQQTYTGCIEVAQDPGGLPQVYENGTEGFSLRFPAGYTSDATYHYQEMGPGKDIGGVKFTIDSAIAKGTNLGSDSYVSVEEIPQATDCAATMFLDQGVKAANIHEDGTDYSVASSTGAGAGNRYEETVYAVSDTNPCIAVRYFIHYGVLDNYPQGAVAAFNENALLSQFDAVRRTLVVNE